MPHPLARSITLRNDLEEIDRMTEFVEQLGEEAGWPQKDLFAITLCLDELLTNIVSYGYDDGSGDHEISLAVEQAGEQVKIVLEDDAKPFDPSKAKDPDLTIPVEDRKPGGLGIYFVRKMMEGFRYERIGDRNRVTLERRLNQAGDAE